MVADAWAFAQARTRRATQSEAPRQVGQTTRSRSPQRLGPASPGLSGVDDADPVAVGRASQLS